MHILFLNPNRYHHPPVIPLGIEYLAGSLSLTRHTFTVLDLCFSDNPLKDTVLKIAECKPDIIGITVRQIDTVLYFNNEYFIDEIKDLVSICKKNNCKVILGGAGFSIMPHEIIEYTGADYGVTGPGELALIKLLDAIEKSEPVETMTDGFRTFRSGSFLFTRIKGVDYQPYLKNEGIVGFRTQIGCSETCIFCTEANKRLIFQQPQKVGLELNQWKEMGYTRFHLCDSEFNSNLEHSIAVCKAIKEIAGPTDWSLYMKLFPFSEDLFFWISQSGAGMLTLSLDTLNTKENKLKETGRFLSLANDYGIKVAIDLSTGFPYEKTDNLKKTVDFLENSPVETVGINSYYRVYPYTGLHKLIKQDKQLQTMLIDFDEGSDFLKPVFFNSVKHETVKEIIGNSKKFRIEGFEKASNYQRIVNK